MFKDRILHHGTLLFNSNLYMLKNSLNVEPGVYKDKAVKSKRSSVTNILEHLDIKITIDEVINSLKNAEFPAEKT